MSKKNHKKITCSRFPTGSLSIGNAIVPPNAFFFLFKMTSQCIGRTVAFPIIIIIIN
jgi:hypothetical protein